MVILSVSDGNKLLPAAHPHIPARVSASEVRPWAVVASAWTFSIAPSSVLHCLMLSWNQNRSSSTPLPHPSCTAVKCKGTVMHHQENHTNYSFLTQTGLKKWLISPLIISPLDKFTKHLKEHCRNECCCYPQYSHARLGANFSLQPKGKSNKLIKKNKWL